MARRHEALSVNNLADARINAVALKNAPQPNPLVSHTTVLSDYTPPQGDPSIAEREHLKCITALMPNPWTRRMYLEISIPRWRVARLSQFDVRLIDTFDSGMFSFQHSPKSVVGMSVYIR